MWFSRWQNYRINGLIKKVPCIADSPTNPSASVHFQSRQCRPTNTCQRLSLCLLYLTTLQCPVCRTLQDMSPPSQRRQQRDSRPIHAAVRSSCNSSDLLHRPIRSLFTRSTLPVADTHLSTGYQILAVACCCKRTSAPQHDRRTAVQLHGLYHNHKSRQNLLFFICKILDSINPLNPELNPICYLLALLAHHFLHVSRIRAKSLTIRLLMSYIYIYIYIYIYGAPILDVSRSHTTTHHSR